MIRLRLYEALKLLPPKSYEGRQDHGQVKFFCIFKQAQPRIWVSPYLGLYNAVIRELVSEFTLTSNQSMTTTSLLRTMCHKDDSILLGTWLQETDHKSVEDQVR